MLCHTSDGHINILCRTSGGHINMLCHNCGGHINMLCHTCGGHINAMPYPWWPHKHAMPYLWWPHKHAMPYLWWPYQSVNECWQLQTGEGSQAASVSWLLLSDCLLLLHKSASHARIACFSCILAYQQTWIHKSIQNIAEHRTEKTMKKKRPCQTEQNHKTAASEKKMGITTRKQAKKSAKMAAL